MYCLSYVKNIETVLKDYCTLDSCRRFSIISSRNKCIGDWCDLVDFIEQYLDSLRTETLLFSLSSYSAREIQNKYIALKSRTYRVSLATGAVAALSLPGIVDDIQMKILVNEIKHYVITFGLERGKLEQIKGHHFEKLKRFELYYDLRDQSVRSCIMTKIKTYLLASKFESIVNIALPIIVSVMSSTLSARYIFKFLNKIVEYSDCVFNTIIDEHLQSPHQIQIYSGILG